LSDPNLHDYSHHSRSRSLETTLKKDNRTAALTAANSRIRNVSNPHSRVSYTDGSQHGIGNTCRSTYSPEETSISRRHPDFTPITVAELTAFLGTFDGAEPTELSTRVQSYTLTPLLPLLILQKHTPWTYLETAHQVWDEDELLHPDNFFTGYQAMSES